MTEAERALLVAVVRCMMMFLERREDTGYSALKAALQRVEDESRAK